MGKHFRKRVATNDEDDEEERRLALEEVKLIQKQRERRSGIAALPVGVAAVGAIASSAEKGDVEGEKEELVLQDTFAQETAVNVEDPNMLKYVEQELSKKRGRQELGKEADENRPEDDLYVIPDHLKVRRRNAEESSTQWTTGIAEVQLPIEYKLRNIEETEAAKRQLQDKRPFVGRQRTQSSNIPSSYSADFFHRGREAAEKEKEKENQNSSTKETGSGRRQAATDEIMLERFRKRERSRMMRR